MFCDYVAKQGQVNDFHIQSAGTHGYHVGEKPDGRGIKAAKTRGVSMTALRASKVSDKDFEVYDHIIAMDQGHYDILSSLRPVKSVSQLSLFMDYVDGATLKDVPDPYYGDDQGFEDMLDLLEKGMEKLFHSVSS